MLTRIKKEIHIWDVREGSEMNYIYGIHVENMYTHINKYWVDFNTYLML